MQAFGVTVRRTKRSQQRKHCQNPDFSFEILQELKHTRPFARSEALPPHRRWFNVHLPKKCDQFASVMNLFFEYVN